MQDKASGDTVEQERNDVAGAARQLLEAVERMAAAYPTDDPDVSPVAHLQLTVGGVEVGEVPLTSGVLWWLADVVTSEHATADASHPGMDGLCAHCTGTGKAGHR